LEASPMRIVHQEQADSGVGRHVTNTDVLPVPAVVCKGKGALINHLEEAARTAAMLNVRPTGLRHRSDVEAVALRNECGLVLRELSELAAAFEVCPKALRTHLRLRGPNARCHSNIQKSIRHDCARGWGRGRGFPKSPGFWRAQAASAAWTTGKSTSVLATSL